MNTFFQKYLQSRYGSCPGIKVLEILNYQTIKVRFITGHDIYYPGRS